MSTKEHIEKLEQQLAVMKAYEEGKRIECRCKGNDTWMAGGAPNWLWDAFDYRVKKQEPVEAWVVLMHGQGVGGKVYHDSITYKDEDVGSGPAVYFNEEDAQARAKELGLTASAGVRYSVMRTMVT